MQTTEMLILQDKFLGFLNQILTW